MKPTAAALEQEDVLRAGLLGQLKAARRRLGLTQADLAERIGINRMTVARAEGDGADPQLSTFLSMTLAMNCKVAVVAEEQGDNAPLPKDLVHRGLSHVRTRHDLDWRDRQREKALAQAWEAANRDEGVGVSPILPVLVPGCTQAQASACATVIQWLGSDIGFGFLQQALERAGYEINEKKGK